MKPKTIDPKGINALLSKFGIEIVEIKKDSFLSDVKFEDVNVIKGLSVRHTDNEYRYFMIREDLFVPEKLADLLAADYRKADVEPLLF